MSFIEAARSAREQLQNSLSKCQLRAEPIVRESSDPMYGDISSPIAHEMANMLGEDADTLAERIVANIERPEEGIFKSIEAKDGYINFRLDQAKWSELVLQEINTRKSNYGKPPMEVPRRILIEHTNSNPNKPLHIGTIRNTILGDCLQRILRFVGNETIVLNYIDDSGAQVADNLVAHLHLGYPLESSGERFDYYAGRVYSHIHSKIELDEDLKKKRSKIISEIERGGNEVSAFARDFSEKVMVNQLRTCWRLGAFFDLLNWESDVVRSGLLDQVIGMLRQKGRAYIGVEPRNAGALLLRLSDIDEFAHLEQPDEVIMRSDSTATYPGKDIAYAWWKVGRPGTDFKYRTFIDQPNGKTLWTTDSSRGGKSERQYSMAELAITIVDARQDYPQRVVRAALGFLSEESARKYLPYLYEVVAISGRTATSLTGEKAFLQRKVVHMSGRKGLVVNAEDILDELSRRARDESKKRNPDAREEWLETIANEIAIGSLRYALVKLDLKSLVVFDVEESLNLEGDTGSRLQYTYARAHGILEKARPFRRTQTKTDLQWSEPEWDLIAQLSKLSYFVDAAARDLQPKVLAHYARALADRFNIFYERCPVLTAETEELRSCRLALVEGFSWVFGTVLELLGVPPLERM